MHREIVAFFLKLDIPVLELYGITECTGLQSLNILSKDGSEWMIGSCGKSVHGMKMDIYNPNEDGEGEVKLILFL